MADDSVETLCQKAQQAVAHGQTEQARQAYLKALQVRPDSAGIHYGLATVYYLLNDWTSAAHHFKEVTRLDSARAGAFINLGAVYNKLDRLDEAIVALRRGIALDHARAEGYYNLGLVYRRQGQSELAIQAYREATRLNPKMTDAHYNLANLFLERQQYEPALIHYQKALELRPKWDKAMHGMNQARAALAETRKPGEKPVEVPAGGDEEPATQYMVDPERPIDPERHSVVLTKLHRATVESQALAQEFADIVQREIETAIKLLSSRLLQPMLTATELEQCVQKVEEALAYMEGAEENLQKHMAKVRKYGDRLLRS